MSNDINKIKKLRQSTGAGFKDCSAALKEGDGDIEKAIEILRIKGISKASKKMSRDANEGVVAVSGDEKKLTLIEVNCETDFVAKNDNFVTFVKELSELNLQSNANIDDLKKSKMKNGDTVDQSLVNLIAKIGEKITIGRTKIINSKGTKNYTYLHTVVRDNLSKLAVIVSIESQYNSNLLKQFGKKLAMHIAASNPLSIDINSIDKTILQKEEKLISEELKNLGKSDEIVKNSGIPYVILRPSNVFGSTMSNQSLFHLIAMVKKGLFVYFGGKGALANYVHVEDVVSALVCCGKADNALGEVYNLSQIIEIEEMVTAFLLGLEVRHNFIHFPELPVRLVIKLFGRLPGFPLTPSRFNALTGRCRYESNKIMQELNFEFGSTLERYFQLLAKLK